MDLDPFVAVALAVFVVIAVADVYFDVLYHSLGRRVLLRVSSGRFPPIEASRVQRLLTSITGLALIVALLLAVLLLSKLLA